VDTSAATEPRIKAIFLDRSQTRLAAFDLESLIDDLGTQRKVRSEEF
jgi:hypothetical protein